MEKFLFLILKKFGLGPEAISLTKSPEPLTGWSVVIQPDCREQSHACRPCSSSTAFLDDRVTAGLAPTPQPSCGSCSPSPGLPVGP
jgi:hypothetical protein